eukprot:6347513-Amphidinium_carterae.1
MITTKCCTLALQAPPQKLSYSVRAVILIKTSTTLTLKMSGVRGTQLCKRLKSKESHPKDKPPGKPKPKQYQYQHQSYNQQYMLLRMALVWASEGIDECRLVWDGLRAVVQLEE